MSVPALTTMPDKTIEQLIFERNNLQMKVNEQDVWTHETKHQLEQIKEIDRELRRRRRRFSDAK